MRLEPVKAIGKDNFYESFNSIKVRLELAARGTEIIPLGMFQFHKGAIRTIYLLTMLMLIICFNSIKVRLEQRKVHRQKRIDHGFNSIKVRLELTLRNDDSHLWKFQFHKGAIRTILIWGKIRNYVVSIP